MLIVSGALQFRVWTSAVKALRNTFYVFLAFFLFGSDETIDRLEGIVCAGLPIL
jgi:hypothetical protein